MSGNLERRYRRCCGCCPAGTGSELDADHDIADFLPCLDIPVCVDDLIQPIFPVDERLEPSGLDQLPEMPYRRLVKLRKGKHDLLAAKERSNEHQDHEQETPFRREIDPARLQQHRTGR
jgi:hypothetical protein